MAKYKYKALQTNNKIVEGEIDAHNLREARELIRNLGFVPTKIYTEENLAQPEIKTTASKTNKINRLTLSEKIMFTSELEVLLSSGISIVEALQTIETHSPNLRIKHVCFDLKNCIISGMTFAQALKAIYGNVFGAVYCGLVKTGEDAGELEATLQRMLVMLRKQDAIKGKIINASIYPCVLIAMILGLLILFAKFVFPRFAGIMEFNGADLPFLAQSIIGTFNFVEHFWWLVLMIVAAVIYIIVNLFKNPVVKSKWDDFILKVPVVSDFISYINLSNFMTVMHISFDAGVPIMAGLELANKTVGNYNIKSQIFKSINLVRNGKSLSEAFERTRAIPPALLSMISAGEKSGTLGKMFHDCADVIDKKVDMALEALTRLFEPTVIVIMGGAVLFIAITFYQVYVSMLGSLF